MKNSLYILIILIFGSGCSIQPSIDDKYVGYWEHVDERYNNWWEIKNNQILNYGRDGEKCSLAEVIIKSDNTLNINFGNKAIAYLDKKDSLLLLVADIGTAKLKAINKTEICKRKGKYFNGAPYKTE